MKIVNITYPKINIELSLQELTILKHIINEVYNALDEFEFEIRVGLSFRQAGSFLNSFTQELDHECDKFILVNLSLSEISVLNNLFNEVCYGIKIQDFKKKIGLNKEEAKQYLALVNQAIKEMDLIGQERKQLKMPSPSDFREVNHKCSLEAEGYKVTFYFKKLMQDINNIGLFIVLNFTSFNDVELTISSLPKPITIEKIEKFINNLENYLKLSQNDLNNPFQIFQSNIFQVQALGKSIINDNKKYVILNFMISLAPARGNIIKPSMGVQAPVMFKNVKNFISSMQKVIIDIKN
ncbi:hypothetical protein [Crocosphaera chwakensis]|uniref:Flavodoxin n=1 Tax=Crocosphaera chwakensis CCY0110 TaxID=391612 RepID=A3IMK3_9CHRO|nr:hypothetical protein [Crocosphaera chwakensis]EAZ92372.1 flavodoxin [Crocosphaera chwakensis CCY0110]